MVCLLCGLQDVQLIEFLDDDEILQEYKSQNKNLVQL